MSFPLSLFNGREGFSPKHDCCLLGRKYNLRSSIGEVDFVDVGLLLTREEFMRVVLRVIKPLICMVGRVKR